MGFLDRFTDERSDHDEYQGKKHKAEVSHELLGGAAAFAAAHEYEEYKARNGEPDSHARAKEIIAGLAGAFIDREVETRGLDFIDKRKAKKEAEERTSRRYNEHVEVIDEYNN